jgi:hypothetical protein
MDSRARGGAREVVGCAEVENVFPPGCRSVRIERCVAATGAESEPTDERDVLAGYGL